MSNDYNKDGSSLSLPMAIVVILIACGFAVGHVAANDWDWSCLLTKCVKVKP